MMREYEPAVLEVVELLLRKAPTSPAEPEVVLARVVDRDPDIRVEHALRRKPGIREARQNHVRAVDDHALLVHLHRPSHDHTYRRVLDGDDGLERHAVDGERPTEHLGRDVAIGAQGGVEDAVTWVIVAFLALQPVAGDLVTGDVDVLLRDC